MKVIIKRPCDQFGEEATIPNTLRALQEAVGGYIETVTLDNGVVLICNEEGKIRDMPYNFTVRRMIHNFLPVSNPIFGTVIACGAEGDEFADIPIDFNEWKALLCEWGN
jgi:hypothetical protein